MEMLLAAGAITLHARASLCLALATQLLTDVARLQPHSQPSSYDTSTHPFNGPFSGTTQVSRYQNGKTNLDFSEARDSE